MQEITIRYLRPKDLHNGFFETLENLTTVGEISKSNSYSHDIFKQMPDNKHIFVAVEKNNKIIGTASIIIEQKFIHNGATVGHIEDVAVHKKYERMGIGSKLLQRCIEIGKENKCYKIILSCSDKNVPFYKKLNFEKCEHTMRLNLT